MPDVQGVTSVTQSGRPFLYFEIEIKKGNPGMKCPPGERSIQ